LLRLLCLLRLLLQFRKQVVWTQLLIQQHQQHRQHRQQRQQRQDRQQRHLQ
jgi:hypothetical protein